MADGIYTILAATDPRLKVESHVFTTPKGACSISVVPTTAASPNTSNIAFQISPPSPQVVIQIAPVLDFTLNFTALFTQSDGTGTTTPGSYNNGVAMGGLAQLFAVWGRDFAIATAAPLAMLQNSSTLQINNGAVQMQNRTVRDLVHLLEGPRGHADRGTTFRTPAYANWGDAYGTTQALGSWADMQGEGDAGPGSFDVQFGFLATNGLITTFNSKMNNQTRPPSAWDRDAAGNPIPPSFTGAAATTVGCYDYHYIQQAGSGGNLFVVPHYGGQPLTTSGWAATTTTGPSPITYPAYAAPAASAPFTTGANGNSGQKVPVNFTIRMQDPLMISPFGFSVTESYRRTGMWGVNTIQLTMQLAQAASIRMLQGCGMNGCVLNPGTQQLAWIPNATVWNTYLTPSTFNELPPQNVLSLCNIQYYPQNSIGPQQVVAWVVGQDMPTTTFNFNNITMGNIPDLLCISFRPDPSQQMSDETDCLYTLPDGAIVNMNFANQSGLFSAWTAERLNTMSKKNGVKCGIQQIGGANGSGYVMSGGRRTIVGGAPLLIRPGEDIPLPEGVSPGSTGQVQLSFQIKINFPQTAGPQRNINCLLTAFSSAYFVTNGGVSRQLLVGLDASALISAPEGASRFMTSRLVGGGFWDTLSAGVKHALSNPASTIANAAGAYHAVKSGNYMGALGHAMAAAGHGGGVSGGGMSGGAVLKRARETLASALAH